MLRAQDSNGPRMLTLITEQFLSDPRLLLWRNQNTPMTNKCRALWEQLGALWVCIVLNPKSNTQERQHWKLLLQKWAAVEVCPPEDPDYRSTPPVSFIFFVYFLYKIALSLTISYFSTIQEIGKEAIEIGIENTEIEKEIDTEIEMNEIEIVIELIEMTGIGLISCFLIHNITFQF